MRRKLVAMVMIGALAMGLLLGCSSNEPTPEKEPETPTNPPAVENNDQAVDNKNVEIPAELPTELEGIYKDLAEKKYKVSIQQTESQGSVLVAEKDQVTMRYFYEIGKNLEVTRAKNNDSEGITNEIADAIKLLYPEKSTEINDWYVQTIKQAKDNTMEEMFNVMLDNNIELTLSNPPQDPNTVFSVMPVND